MSCNSSSSSSTLCRCSTRGTTRTGGTPAWNRIFSIASSVVATIAFAAGGYFAMLCHYINIVYQDVRTVHTKRNEVFSYTYKHVQSICSYENSVREHRMRSQIDLTDHPSGSYASLRLREFVSRSYRSHLGEHMYAQELEDHTYGAGPQGYDMCYKYVWITTYLQIAYGSHPII